MTTPHEAAAQAVHDHGCKIPGCTASEVDRQRAAAAIEALREGAKEKEIADIINFGGSTYDRTQKVINAILGPPNEVTE
jgi:hypothetical protein